MKVWKLLKDGKLLEVWDVDNYGEMIKSTKLELKQPMTRDEAREWVDTYSKAVYSTVVPIR